MATACSAQVTITHFPTTGIYAYWITSGPDGNLWFTEGNKIGRITTSGLVTEFPVPAVNTNEITSGPDDNLWFTGSGSIGRITTTGVVTKFPLPTAPNASTGLDGITAGPDGNLQRPGNS